MLTIPNPLSDFFKIFLHIEKPTTPNLGYRSCPNEIFAREKHGFRRASLGRWVYWGDENPWLHFQVPFDLQMLFRCLSICKCTIYIIEEPARLPWGGTGRLSASGSAVGYIPPPRKRPRSSLLFFYFQVVRLLSVRGGNPHTRTRGGGCRVYSPIDLVGDACGCTRVV
jgi:hypothetical protein